MNGHGAGVELRSRVLVLDSPRLGALPAAAGRYTLRVVAGWVALAAALEADGAPALALLDPWDAGDDGTPSPLLRELLRRHPAVSVVAAIQLAPGHAEVAGRLLRWGVSEVLDLGCDAAPGALAARLDAAWARPLKRRAEPLLGARAGEDAHNLVRCACEVVAERGGAEALAARCRMRPDMLAACCSREGLPPPRRLITWTRRLLAAMLLDAPGGSPRRAAQGAGYPDAEALERDLRRVASGRAAPGGAPPWLAAVSRAFTRELRWRREQLRAPRDPGGACWRGEPRG